MADSKITALAALTAADPVNDMFPVVDVSDTSMAASGTTKRISVNNILSSSPTASGALTVTGLVTAGSATITGAATVGTTLGVTGVSTLASVGVTGAATVGTTLGVTGVSTLTGNVGIGTAPDSKLRVLDAAGNGMRIGFSSGSANLNLFDATSHQFRPLSGSGTNFGEVNVNGIGIARAPSASGIGIAFPATQSASSDANTLDDYEEGTWTPVVTSVGGALGSVTGQTGTYTKIGRMVTATGYFEITTNGTGSSAVALAGLPFANGGLANIGVGRVDGTTGNMVQVKINASASTANIWKYDNTYPAADGAQFPITLVYYV